MYPAPHTWVVGDPWPVTDANTYIRDALTSVRRYQNSSGQMFNGGSGFTTLTTTTETVVGGTHYNLMSSTPDEAYRMVVIANCVLNESLAGGSPANGASFGAYDQSGAGIGNAYSSVQASGDAECTIVAGGLYAAGSNNGFVIKCTPFANTRIDVFYSAVVFFLPQV